MFEDALEREELGFDYHKTVKVKVQHIFGLQKSQHLKGRGGGFFAAPTNGYGMSLYLVKVITGIKSFV